MSKSPRLERVPKGVVFALPVTQGWALGVSMRNARKSPALFLGCYFPFVFPRAPELAELPEFTLEDSIYISRTSALKISTGEWKSVARIADWSDSEWPMPRFHIRPRVEGGRWMAEVFDEDDCERPIRREVIDDPTVAIALPEEGLAGNVYVEQRLSKLIAQTGSRGPVAAPRGWYVAIGESNGHSGVDDVEAESRQWSGVEVAVSYRVRGEPIHVSEGRKILMGLEDAVVELLRQGVDDIDGIESGVSDGVLRIESSDPDRLWSIIDPTVKSIVARPLEIRLIHSGDIERLHFS